MKNNRNKKMWLILTALVMVGCLIGCSTMEQKRDKFVREGIELYDKGDYVRARLQFKNALQIDQKYGPAYLWLAKTELKTENFRGAYGALQQALELDPKMVEAQVLLGRILLGGKQFDEVQKCLNKALELDPKNSDALLLKASLAMLQNKPEEAKATLKEIKTIDPKKFEIYLLQAQIEATQKNLEAAALSLDEGLKVLPEQKELYIARARLADSQKQFDQGEKYLLELEQKQPNKGETQAELIRHYVLAQQLDKAEQALRKQMQLEPGKEQHVINLVKLLSSTNKNKEAEQELTAFIAKYPDNIEARFALADYYIARRQEGKAFKTLTEISNKESSGPNSLKAKDRMAALHASRGRTSEAEKLASEVLKENPKDMGATRTMGLLAIGKKDGLAAVNNFRLLVQDQPQNMEARLLLAQAHLLNNEKEQAREQAKKALELKPDSVEVRRFLYSMYINDKDYKGAIDTIQSYLRYNEKDLFNLTSLGEAYFAKGDLAAARATFNRIISLEPNNPLGYFEMARLELKQKQNDAGIKYLEQALNQKETFLPALQLLTSIYIEQNKPLKAVEVVNKMLARSPDNPVLLQMLGELLLVQKKPQEASQALEKAFTLNPRQMGALRLLVIAYQQNPDKDQVTKALEVKVNDPKAPKFYNLAQAMYFEGMKEYDQAQKVYDRMIEQNIFTNLAKNNYAYLLANYNPNPEKIDRAIKLVSEALDEVPDDPNILDTKGWILCQRGDYSQAVTYLKQAAESSPNSPTIQYHLGFCEAKSGEVAKAQETLEKVLETKTKFSERAAAETLLLQLRSEKETKTQ